jgi:carboxyl-terminal processing protease
MSSAGVGCLLGNKNHSEESRIKKSDMFANSSKEPGVIAILVFNLLLLTACGASRPIEPAIAAKPSSATLSQKDRIDIFEDVWRTINDGYYDPSFHGVNWQAAHDHYRPQVEAATTDNGLYSLLEVMLAELRDAHTVFTHPPPQADDTFQPSGSVGITLREIENKTVVATVEPDSDAARAGVKPGMVLRTVNGRPVGELYSEIRSQLAGSSTERSMRNVLHGAVLYGGFLGSSRRFGIESFDGNVLDVAVTHFGQGPPETASLTARRLPSGYGYVGFDGWKPGIDDQFSAEIAKLGDTRGLILDLRGNGGGQTDVVLNIASLFFPGETSFGKFMKRSGAVEDLLTHRTEPRHIGPVAILIDDNSASASEVFAVSMQENGRARVIGQQSCGCVLNQTSKSEKGGGTLKWSARVYSSPRGRVLEGTGVTPDEIVNLTISDLRNGRDVTLDRAQKALSVNRQSP